MVKRRTRVALSVVSGVAAVMVAMVYAANVRAEAEAAQDEILARYGGEMVEVCVAARDIEPGEIVDEGNVSVEEWVAGLLPEDAQTSLTDVIGKTATSYIPKRAVLCPQYFTERAGELEIPDGTVAVSVASDAEHSVGGSLERGDTVDVYISKDGVADKLCDARIVDTSALADGGGEVSWVTLAVEPSHVEELLAATTRAPVTLVVPGDGIEEPAEQKGGEQ